MNCIPVFAAEESTENQILKSGGNGSTQVELTVTENPLASIFSATIPAVIPAAVDSSGIVTVPENIAIRNNNTFKGIQVTDIAVEPADTWELTNFDSGDFSEMNGNHLSLSLRGDAVSEESQKIGLSTDNWNIGANDSLQIPMELKLNPQNKIGSLGNIASIVFTLDWWDGTTTSVSEKIQWNLDGENHSKQLYATFPSDVQGEMVTWNSSNSSVASVDQTGLVSIGTVAGKSIISASCGNYQKEIAEISTISTTVQEFTITPENRAAIGYTDETTDLVIPETFVGDGNNETVKGQEYLVTTLSHNAFKNCKKIKSVKIPESVVNWGDFIFAGDSQLVSVDLPETLTRIPYGIFFQCTNLLFVNIPNNVTSIAAYAFYECKNLSSIVIPDNTTLIGLDSFYCCESLTSITIPDSVSSLGKEAFGLCSNLTSVVLSNNLKYIPYRVFSGCSNLQTVKNISSSVISIDDMAFCGTNISFIDIPNSVKSIGNATFAFCRSLQAITIPDSVTSIDQYAFQDCKNLRTVTLSKNLSRLTSDVFIDCENLKTINTRHTKNTLGGSPWGATNATVNWLG